MADLLPLGSTVHYSLESADGSEVVRPAEIINAYKIPDGDEGDLDAVTLLVKIDRFRDSVKLPPHAYTADGSLVWVPNVREGAGIGTWRLIG